MKLVRCALLPPAHPPGFNSQGRHARCPGTLPPRLPTTLFLTRMRCEPRAATRKGWSNSLPCYSKERLKQLTPMLQQGRAEATHSQAISLRDPLPHTLTRQSPTFPVEPSAGSSLFWLPLLWSDSGETGGEKHPLNTCMSLVALIPFVFSYSFESSIALLASLFVCSLIHNLMIVQHPEQPEHSVFLTLTAHRFHQTTAATDRRRKINSAPKFQMDVSWFLVSLLYRVMLHQ